MDRADAEAVVRRLHEPAAARLDSGKVAGLVEGLRPGTGAALLAIAAPDAPVEVVDDLCNVGTATFEPLPTLEPFPTYLAARIFQRRVAAAPWPRRGLSVEIKSRWRRRCRYSVETSRGGAAATWTFRGDESRRRRGDDNPWR